MTSRDPRKVSEIIENLELLHSDLFFAGPRLYCIFTLYFEE